MNTKWNFGSPYILESFNRLLNHYIAVQTVRGSVRGMLRMVAPDHIVVEMGGCPFYIRIEQIIWIQPL